MGGKMRLKPPDCFACLNSKSYMGASRAKSYKNNVKFRDGKYHDVNLRDGEKRYIKYLLRLSHRRGPGFTFSIQLGYSRDA